MAIYITQGKYTGAAIKGLLAKPEDREKEVRALIERNGGKLVAYYITFGEYDWMTVSENADPLSVMGHRRHGRRHRRGLGHEDHARLHRRRRPESARPGRRHRPGLPRPRHLRPRTTKNPGLLRDRGFEMVGVE